MNESSYHLAITIVEFPDDVHLISLKSRFDACLECQVTVLSKLNFKKRVCKKYLFSEKICSPAGFEPECKSVAIPIELSVLWSFDEMLLEFSPLLCLQAAAERKLITTLTHGDKLEVGG